MNLILQKKGLAVLGLVLILALAFFLRINTGSIDLVDSDSFYHARMVEYLIKNNSIPKTDPLAYYQVEGGVPLVEAGFLWYAAAGVYNLVYPLAGFDFERMYSLLMLFPVLCGLAAVFLIYLISRDLFGKRVGLAAAFIGAVLPSLIYRTSRGFFEDENIGIVLLLLSCFLYFRVLSEKRFWKRLIYSTFCGIILALMSLTWKAYLLVPLILLAQTCIGQVLIALREERKEVIIDELKEYSVLSAWILILTFLGAISLGQNLFSDISFYLMLGGVQIPWQIVLMFFVCAILMSSVISVIIIIGKDKVKNHVSRLLPLFFYMFWAVLGLALLFILKKTAAGISMFIYEELPGTFFFWEQNGLFLILALIAMFLLPFSIKTKSGVWLSRLFLFLMMTAGFFMAAYQVKHMLLFGAIAPVGIAFLLWGVVSFLKNSQKNIFKGRIVPDKSLLKTLLVIVFLIIFVYGLFLSISTASGIESVTQKIYGVKEASVWLNENSDVNSRVFAWWDAGHVITFFSGRKVVCDNRNYLGQLSTVNKDVAEFFITEDINKGFEIIRGYDSDYLVIYPQLFTQMRVLDAYYFGPKSALDEAGSQNYYGLCERVDSNIICDGRVLVDMRESGSDYWTNLSNALIDGRKYYFYLGEDFYFMLDESANNSNLAKVFFESADTIKYYKKVYSVKGTRVFKILK